MLWKEFCMQARSIVTNLSPNPARPEKSGLAYNSDLIAIYVVRSSGVARGSRKRNATGDDV